MAPNDVGKTQMDDSSLPLKQEDCPILLSSVNYSSMAGQLHGTSSHHCTDAIESNDLSQCGTSLSGLQQSCANPQSNEQAEYVVKGVKIEKYNNMVLNRVHIPSSEGLTRSTWGHWSHLYQFVDGSKPKDHLEDPLSKAKDKLMVSVRENSSKGDPSMWHLRHLKTKHIDEKGVLASGGSNLNSGSSSLPQDARIKILSTSSFSHFFGKKTQKGKGVIYGHPRDKSHLDNGGDFQSNGGLNPTSSATSGAQMQLLQHTSGGILLDTKLDGINLRDWLKPGHRIKNKVEGLCLFRQIVELVNSAHSRGVALQHLRPSYFILMPSNKLKYIGLSTQIGLDVPISQAGNEKEKRLPEEDIHALGTFYTKKQKLTIDKKVENQPSLATSRSESKIAGRDKTNYNIGCSSGSDNSEHRLQGSVSHQATGLDKSLIVDLYLEEKWYASPEDLGGKSCKCSSNIYSLGVLLFELLCPFDSLEAQSAAMFDLHHRILPPFFLSESSKEAGFCLWLIHPEPSSRPTIREILLSDLLCGSRDLDSSGELLTSANDGMAESELLLDFLVSLEEHKQEQEVKLIEDIRCIQGDLKRLEAKPLSSASQVTMKRDGNLQDFMMSVARSGRSEARWINDMCQLEKSYFSMRSQSTSKSGTGRADSDLLKNREIRSRKQNQNEVVSKNQKSADGLDIFFEDLCKFSCYSKLDLRGTLRNGDLLNSTNVICSLSFDRDEEYIAVAGVSKKIKIFEFCAVLNDAIDIHYPVVEMGNKSKLSCISWNSYTKNCLASTDYDGVVQVWDASTGLGFSQHIEHQKRAWSVDFSRVDPTKFASGSDDCSVKLWCTNEKRSTCTIWSPANVCCVQFSPYSSNLLAFGSADYKIYGYDLRHTRIPWCTLAGHEKTVSYVKFLDSETLVSASTDNTLKLWDLNKTSLSGLSSEACHLTFTGHTNKKHFVGLSVRDGYLACGSESNEVFTYYRSLPIPITCYKFSPIVPVTAHEVGEDNGLFVSSVCWSSKSNMIVAANSAGSIRLLQLV